MDSFAGSVKPKPTLRFISFDRSNEGREGKLTRTIPTQMQNMFTRVKTNFFDDENHVPQFIYSQKMPGRPKLNQLAKRAPYN